MADSVMIDAARMLDRAAGRLRSLDKLTRNASSQPSENHHHEARRLLSEAWANIDAAIARLERPEVKP